MATTRSGISIKKGSKDKGPEKKHHKNNNDNICYRCGKKGCWPNLRRASKQEIDLYQA